MLQARDLRPASGPGRSSAAPKLSRTWAASRAEPREAAGLRYRPDIDGLRALAVVPVVLFHLDVALARGGFIGVDVFFVISGYLITRILQSDIERGRYSILSFYDRRIRRIFPALFAMLLASAVTALFVLLPPEIMDFARSVIATVLFVSNMHYLAATDYFNSAGNVSPLLHTWSLAVEEQFYLVFPLLLYGLRAAPRRVLLATLASLGLLSFALSVALVRVDQTAAFYLSPARAWELLLGAVVALSGFPPVRRAWLREAVAGCGVLLILGGVALFYAAMPFPGARALVPCLGAACVLLAGETGPTAVSRLLSLRPVVFLGLISYSLYLWHWPIIVFARLWWVAPLDGWGKALLFVASVVAGTLSWRFLERPFRIGRLLAAPLGLRWAALAVSLAALVSSAALLGTRGIAAAFPPGVDRVAGFLHYDDRPVYRRGTCFLDAHRDTLADYPSTVCLARDLGRPRLLLIGDSHAAHLWSGLAAGLPRTNVLQATASGCKPVFGGKGVATCVALVDRALDLATGPAGIDSVVLSARWELADIPAMLATVARLAPRVGTVYVAGPIVEYSESLPRLLALAQLRRTPAPLDDGRLLEQRSIDASMRTALIGQPAIYLSSYRALCPAAASTCVTTATDEAPVQWDYGHLTAQGSALVVDKWLADGLLREQGR